MSKQKIERRKFIRHPVDIPIRISPEHLEGRETVLMRDVSAGGLAVQTDVFYKEGTHLNVYMPDFPEPLKTIGVVCWHRHLNDQYLIGIRLLNPDSTLRTVAERVMERRKFIRHPVDIPIQISPQYLEDRENVLMRDVSAGGLAVQTGVFYEEGAHLNVCIPNVPKPFEAIGVVCWHRHLNDQYQIGIRFLDEGSTLRMRMVEQICQIEQYRKQLMAGGNLTSFEYAAKKWADKHAEDYWRNWS